MVKRRFLFIGLTIFVVLLIAGLAYWSFTAPPPLEVQTPSQLQTGIFSVSRSVSWLNTSDSSGVYSFKLGLDYDSNISQGSSTEVKVYVALVSESISSPFMRKISMAVTSASFFVDGVDDPTVTTKENIVGGLLVESIQNPNTDLSLGLHNFTARLVVSTIDINYIGYSVSPPNPTDISGLFNITAT